MQPRIGMRTPWGTADHIEQQDAVGDVFFVGTPGHGGLKLSRKANAKIPAAFRRAGGWYEEDCEYVIPYQFLGASWFKPPPSPEVVLQVLKDYWPDAFETVFGEVLKPGESRTKDERAWAEKHANDYVAVSAWGDWHAKVPAGKVGVCVRLGGRDRPATADRYFLVDDAEYTNRGSFGFVVEPARCAPWCGPNG